MNAKCALCGQPESKHFGPKRVCPRETYFTPCKHPNRSGMGAMSSDGTGWSDTTCMACGDRQVIGKPSYSTNDATVKRA